MKSVYLSLFTVLLVFSLQAQQILPERERAEVVDAVLNERFTQLLPRLMDETGIDMWLVISREYNEDPIIKTMLPAIWLNARRRTILLFYHNKVKDTVERLAVALAEAFICAFCKRMGLGLPVDPEVCTTTSSEALNQSLRKLAIAFS
jgi:hypothetical protein